MTDHEKQAFHALKHVLAALANTDNPGPADLPPGVERDVEVLHQLSGPPGGPAAGPQKRTDTLELAALIGASGLCRILSAALNEK
ncbi:MAG: hypothetical protein LJE60_01805 [Thiocapsa sp.]|nr:hypothetical protein [Thiocapsa sp.]MCG6895833.1 hypothetical protein [Thiocapsa sp.]